MNKIMKNVYAISYNAQKQEVDEYCFKKCGKICLGCLNIEGGQFLPCGEDNCPYLDKQILTALSLRIIISVWWLYDLFKQQGK